MLDNNNTSTGVRAEKKHNEESIEEHSETCVQFFPPSYNRQMKRTNKKRSINSERITQKKVRSKKERARAS